MLEALGDRLLETPELYKDKMEIGLWGEFLLWGHKFKR